MVGIACVSVYYTNGLVFDPLDMNFGVVSFNTKYSDQACVCVWLCLYGGGLSSCNKRDTKNFFNIWTHENNVKMNHLAQIVFALTLHPSPSITGHVHGVYAIQENGWLSFSIFVSHSLTLSFSHACIHTRCSSIPCHSIYVLCVYAL